ncbi:MAG: hypothetical protein MI976_10730 [Pseudomonadales bacterium]|nr:hypothetical protein [Pseudomonadales bacterium]
MRRWRPHFCRYQVAEERERAFFTREQLKKSRSRTLLMHKRAKKLTETPTPPPAATLIPIRTTLRNDRTKLIIEPTKPFEALETLFLPLSGY